MKTLIFMLFAVAAGAVLPFQAALNVKMGKAVGEPVYAAFISFLVGAIGLFFYLLAIRTELSALSEAKTLNWSVWTAGLMGAFYVACVIVLSPKLGVALTFALVVMGQLSISLLIDHFGMLGIPVHTISWQRIAGVLLIVGGVVLIRKV